MMMDTRLILISYVLLLLRGAYDINAFVMQCPAYEQFFQKVVGHRPPSDRISQMNLVYSNSDSSELANPNCYAICSQDENCQGYVLFLDTKECYGFSIFDRLDVHQNIRSEIELVADANAIYFEKLCLKVPDTCKGKLWAITKIPGSSLVFQGKKTLSTLVTRRECAERCLHEREFQCLSASFTPSFKNNQRRLSEQRIASNDIVGRCILSDKDKTIRPDAFRAAPFEEEYIENQCYARPAENENCSYELYSNSTFIYSEDKYVGLTQKECQHKCSHESRFYCQGASYYFERDSQHTECLLHSEDLISMGPRSLRFKLKSVYMRRVTCLDISVICNQDEMVIKYMPKSWFRGHMYVSSHSQDCSVPGNATGPTILRLPIGSEIKESKCGILRAYEVSKNYQRIFISTLVVVQNNQNVQTQGDRLVKVGCIISNATSNGGMLPDAIALESSLAFTQSELPNQGSIHLNLSSLHIPKIRMEVVDLSQHFKTNDVQIGQDLELQIIADPPSTPFDFEATSLVAKSSANNSTVPLIDENGCPLDVSIFPALERVHDQNVRMLRARFHAFKFAGTSVVSFDVKIHFCLEKCPPKNCSARSKRKRESHEVVQIKNPLYVSTFSETSESGKLKVEDAMKTDANDSKPMLDVELPLKFELNVRGPQHITDSDGLIYGENGLILLAGLDHDHDGTFCINQSLLIAILIFWIIFQIVLMVCCCHLIRRFKHLTSDDDRKTLQKIHESLDCYEGRRVRWADQGGGYTL